jgi:AcrR family transcriptional regulator
MKTSSARSGTDARPRVPEETREKLMGAATSLFAEKGFDGARVEAIAKKARVNKAMISYHFGGKEGLYRAILLSTFESAIQRLKALEEMAAPADEQLREFVRLFAGVAAARPGLPAMLLREVLSGGRHLDEEILPHFLGVFGHVRRIVARGIREGTFRPVDPLLTHLSLIGALVFFFSTSPLRARLGAEGKLPAASPSDEAFVEHIQDLITRGLATGRPMADGGEEEI